MPVNYKNGSDHQESTPKARRRIQSQPAFPKQSGSGQIHHSSPTLLRSMTSGATARRSSVSRFFGLKRPPRRCPRPDLTKAAFENVTSALRSGIGIYQTELSKRKETVSGSPRVSRAVSSNFSLNQCLATSVIKGHETPIQCQLLGKDSNLAQLSHCVSSCLLLVVR
jgi:hypothetical protein